MRHWFTTSFVIGVCALIGTPAVAGRGTQVDVGAGGAACYLGSTSCTGVEVWASGIFTTAYIYKEGIVSFDGLLPVGATSSDLSSLGSGNYLAVGFSDSANYGTSAFKRIGTDEAGHIGFTAYAFNFYNQGEPRYAFDPDTGEFLYSFAPALQGQLFSLSNSLDENLLFAGGVGLAAGYRPGEKPLPDSFVGFQLNGVQQMVKNSNGLLIGSAPTDTDVFTQTYYNPGYSDVAPSWSAATRFTPLYGAAPIPAGVPEPSQWTILMLGFGVVGGLMRRRKSEGRAIA